MRRAAEAVETEKLEQIGLLLLHYVRLMLGVAKVAGAVELVGLEKVESGVPNSDYLMRQAAEFEQQANFGVEFGVRCHEQLLRQAVEGVALEKLYLGAQSWEQTTPWAAGYQEVGQVSRSFAYGPYFQIFQDLGERRVLSTKLERKALTFHAKYPFCFQILKYDKISERERKDPASGNIRPGG